MTAETQMNNGKGHKSLSGSHVSRRPGSTGRISIHVALGLVLFIALSLVILSVDDEPDSPAQPPESAAAPPDEGEAANDLALSESPDASREISPRSLEDFRTAPTDELEIQPEPIAPPSPPEPGTEPGIDETPALAGQEAAPPEGTEEPASGTDDFSLGQALANYLINNQDDMTKAYVEECIRYRNENGLDAGCPENPALAGGSNPEEKALVDDLFAIITRQSDYARISQRLKSENETLAAILADPANPGASQASSKMALNNSYLEYLNGNRSPAVTTFDKMNDFVNDYNRTIMSGPVQFRCKGGPCLYEYTGPGAR